MENDFNRQPYQGLANSIYSFQVSKCQKRRKMAYLKRLFEPARIGQVELKNRIVMPATSSNYAENGRVTDRMKNYYAARAKGGAGLLVIGIIAPTNLVREGQYTVRLAGIYDDKLIPGLRQLTDVVHDGGAKVGIQLSIRHEWAKDAQSPIEFIAPSNVPISPGPAAPAPRPLTIPEIEQIVDAFGEASRRAREAGFDMVEFHASVGYLINQFLSSKTNIRDDAYGGSLENRARFLLEIIDSARRKAGADYTFTVRLSGADFMDGGNTIEDTKVIAGMLERVGISALSVTTGWHESPVPFIQMSVPRGSYVYLAEEVKKVVNIPVVGGTRVNDPILAEQILAEGKVDMIYMSRPLMADPDLPNKAREGRFDEIRNCTACCLCFDRLMEGMPTACSVNAQAGREVEYAIEPAPKPKKVFILGGGPAGMEAARVAAVRGHKVTLVEKKDKLGGQLLVATVPPHKEELHELIRYFSTQMEKQGVEVRLGKETTPDYIIDANPDEVIVAGGAVPIIPDIPGVRGENVVTAIDVLSGEKETGDSVVIIGGGLVGCETAEYLSQKGKEVTILEMLPKIGNDIGRTTRWVVLRRLREAGIKLESKAKAVEITAKGVAVSRDGGSEVFEADTVVLSVGLVPNRELAQKLEGKVKSLRLVGDCDEPHKIAEAIESGLRVGREI